MGWGDLVELADGTLTKSWPMHAGQWDLMQSRSRFSLASAGTGGGKTAMGPPWIYDECGFIMKDRNVVTRPIKGLIVAPTHQVLQRATLPELIKGFQYTELEGHVKKPSTIVYELPNNWGEFWCVSADSPEHIEGGQFDFAWLDEGGQIRYEAWVAVQGRLGQRQGRALITTTPYRRNWLYSRFYKLWKAGDPNYFVRTWRSCDNPAYPVEEYLRAKNSMSPQRFAMRYNGEFAKMTGLVLENYEKCVDDFKEVPSSKSRHYGGIDWGFAPDPFAAICGSLVLDKKSEYFGHVFFWFERYVRYKTYGENAERLPKGVIWYCGQENPTAIREMRDKGLIIRANAVTDRFDGLDDLLDFMATGKAHFHPTLTSLWAEAEEWHWPTEEDEIIGEEPIGPEHAISGLRYMVSNMKRQGLLDLKPEDDFDV